MYKRSVVITEVILAIAMLLIPVWWFDQQISALLAEYHEKVGVTFIPQLFVIAYVLGNTVNLLIGKESAGLSDQLKHLKHSAEMCFILGVVGTYIALIDTIQKGLPSIADLSHAFYSTLLGMLTVLVATFFAEIIRFTRQEKACAHH